MVDVMSTVKELMPSPAGTVAAADEDAGADVAGADEEEDEDEDEFDEQAAAVRARTPARATQPSRGRGLNAPWPCERESPPPCLLLPSSIPYPFRKVHPDEPTRDTVQHVCPYERKGRS
jgi:hypothetical protein